MSTRAKSEEVKAINQKIIQLAESFAAQMERLNNRRDDVNAGKSKTNKKARTDDNDNVDVDVISEATSTQDELVLVSDVSETASAPGGRGGGGAGAGAAAAANATLFVVRRNVLASGPAHQFSDRQRNLMRFFFNELGLSKPQIANLFGMAGQALNAFAFDADEACLAVARADVTANLATFPPAVQDVIKDAWKPQSTAQSGMQSGGFSGTSRLIAAAAASTPAKSKPAAAKATPTPTPKETPKKSTPTTQQGQHDAEDDGDTQTTHVDAGEAESGGRPPEFDEMELSITQTTHYAGAATREHWAKPGSGWTPRLYATHIFTWDRNPTFRVVLSDK